MMKHKKKYFSFFGILSATINRKISSYFSAIASVLQQEMPKIAKLLFAKQLKPIKQYSTNNI